jgi:hypothetical protein
MNGAHGTIGEMSNATKLKSENIKGRDHLGDPCRDGRIILKCISNRWSGFNSLRIASSGSIV